ncbi:E3 ubiquitin-protein ligase RNF31 isoform X2 [Stegastes partitus]|uniref:E3 ubiquitin-protein ligase RNF31 isoform X2 n=1 Tax=Stegastes partitus TaxID=144197 RepID=A0A9Y4U2I5_9TELE|nr:PREDICTED: E3 ubiquitin-protein ligase RNF31-like isoform X2 [Stegastes partitus]
MPRISPEAELRTLAECRYSFPAETLSDLQAVRARFSDLRLYVDFYCFPNNEKKKLLYLAGTLPVYYEGAEYNIPVCIWLHETHPASRPRCYVCPSVTMVINPSCPCVDAYGNISVETLNSWSQGVSNLSQLVSEMRRVFQKDMPLFARQPVQAPPPAGVQVLQSADSVLSSSSSQHSVSPSSSHLSEHPASRLELRMVRAGRSYTEELLGIDFSAPPPSPSNSNPFIRSSPSGAHLKDPLSRQMGALRLDGESSRDKQAGSPVQITQSEAARDRQTANSGPACGLNQDFCRSGPPSRPATDLIQMAAQLPPDQATLFRSLMAMEGRSFIPADAMEAVQLNRDLPSALRFLSHSCPICQEQVSFSKIITMTHCSCFLCQSCFKLFFLAAIKERSVDQLVCPQCGRPEVRGPGGLEESMDYFSLLDTQIRHFLPPEIHELFQRKLRDRALQEMPNFCWCAHCSFGMLHEADRLRMDCPSCKKSTCSKCRSPWFPQHQSLSCEQFRVWKQQNQPDHHSSPLLYTSIECPNCQLVFSLSRGGCLHFTCSQCGHQFCGGCSQRFTLGSACGFSADCGNKGLHAHHPRNCLYHLRDWSVTRLHLLLQHYRVSPSWLEPASGSPPDIGLAAVCLVLELRDDSSRQEEPCGRPARPEYKGYCQLHYKERLVELINRCRADPAVLFSPAEMMVELQRWQVAVPTRKPDEPEALYAHRLCLVSDIITDTAHLSTASCLFRKFLYVSAVRTGICQNQFQSDVSKSSGPAVK